MILVAPSSEDFAADLLDQLSYRSAEATDRGSDENCLDGSGRGISVSSVVGVPVPREATDSTADGFTDERPGKRCAQGADDRPDTRGENAAPEAAGARLLLLLPAVKVVAVDGVAAAVLTCIGLDLS